MADNQGDKKYKVRKNLDIRSIYEYLGVSPSSAPLDEISLSKIYPELSIKTESSVKRFYRIIKEGEEKKNGRRIYPFFRKGKHKISGLSDVIESLAEKLYIGSISFEHGQTPITLFVGPTGSGKTELGLLLEEGMINDLYENPKYTYIFREVNGKKNIPCPYTEDPINLLTSTYLLIPKDVKRLFSDFHYNELCPPCRENLEKLLRENGGVEDGKEYLDLLHEKIKIVPLQPKTAMIDLAKKKFPEVFDEVVKRANRGLLHISIDDRDIDKIQDENYQILLALADRKVSLCDGSFFTPDMLVILYANENTMEKLYHRATLKDRLLPVYVRRNLSYSAEEDIFKKIQLPFKHITPGGLGILAKFAVGTRIKSSRKEDLIDKLEIFEKYENVRELTEREMKELEQRIPPKGVPKDGWTSGLSSRAACHELLSISHETEKCLTLEGILKFLEKTEYKIPANISIDLVNDMAFRDTSLAFISLVSGGVDKIEENFSYFIDLMREKRIKHKDHISVPGRGSVPIDDEMRRVAKKLGMKKGGAERLEKIIYDYIEPEKEDIPTFGEILTKYPDIIAENENIKNYISWKEFRRAELAPRDMKRVKKLLGAMRDLGYDEECAEAALKIAARRLMRIWGS